MIGVSVAVILDKQKVLLAQRKKDARYALKWEFPGGKIEEGESPEDAMIRECKEELGITIHNCVLLEKHGVTLSDKGEFYVYFYGIKTYTGEIINHVFENVQWVDIDDCLQFDLLEGNVDFCSRLPQILQQAGIRFDEI